VIPVLAFAGCVLAATGRASAAKSCIVDSASISFGSYDVYAGALAATGTIAMTCTWSGKGAAPAPYAKLNAGNGTVNKRYMICVSGPCLSGFSGDRLFYNVYTDAAHTTVWKNGAATGEASTPADCSNTTCNWTIYGLIPAAIPGGTNDVAVGGYSDSLLLTVAY
jgi:spore coat protein U-like protein